MESSASNCGFAPPSRAVSCSSIDGVWEVVARVRAVELAVSSVIAASDTAAIIKENLFCFMSVSPYLIGCEFYFAQGYGSERVITQAICCMPPWSAGAIRSSSALLAGGLLRDSQPDLLFPGEPLKDGVEGVAVAGADHRRRVGRLNGVRIAVADDHLGDHQVDHLIEKPSFENPERDLERGLLDQVNDLVIAEV